MEKLETYCTCDFLESIYDRIKRPLSEFLLEDNDGLWIAELYRFIHGNCTLVIDISEEEIIRRSIHVGSSDYNPNFKKLWKRDKVAFVSYQETFKQMLIDEGYFKGKSNEIYFLSANKDFCQEIEKRYGLLCCSIEEMDEKLPDYFIFDIESIKKRGRIKSWNFLGCSRYPSNSAIIADNYLFQNRSSKGNNILEILQNIMPVKLDEIFHLTIFTRDVNNIEDEYKYLNDYLLAKFPYRINLSIGIVDKGSLGIHDRDIITSYTWYHSGAGFSLFNHDKNGITISYNTNVFIYPVTYVGHYSKSIEMKDEKGTPVQASYFSALEIFKKVWNELPDEIENYKKTFIGERKNRLLD